MIRPTVARVDLGELVRLEVDLIVAHFSPAVRAAMGATKTIPIVMAPAGAPLQSGFISSLARPAPWGRRDRLTLVVATVHVTE